MTDSKRKMLHDSPLRPQEAPRTKAVLVTLYATTYFDQ